MNKIGEHYYYPIERINEIQQVYSERIKHASTTLLSINMISKKSAENHILHSDKEIILTGRNPAEIFTDNADYISEIKAIRHPYNKGISARKGIEF